MSVVATDTHTIESGLFGGLFSNDNYWPSQPRDLAEAGLSESFVEASSGYAALDVTALLAVRRALRERPPPPAIKEKGMMATVAITFALPENAHAAK